MLQSQSSRVPRPITDLAECFSPRLGTVNALTLLVAAGGFAVFLLAPLVARAGVVQGTGIGLTELDTGVLLIPECVLMMVGGAAYCRLVRKRRSSQLLTCRAATVLLGLVLSAVLPASVRDW